MPDPLTFMWNTRQGCKLHPNSKGDTVEVKTIGLTPREGESHEQAYARWGRRQGWECSCAEPLKTALAQFEVEQ